MNLHSHCHENLTLTFFKLWTQILVALFCECVYSLFCPYLFKWLKCAGSPSELNIDHPFRQLLILSVCFVYLHVRVWSLVILWLIISYIWIWKLDAAYILLSPFFSWLYWLSGNFIVLTLLIACFSWFSWVWLPLGTSTIPPWTSFGFPGFCVAVCWWPSPSHLFFPFETAFLFGLEVCSAASSTSISYQVSKLAGHFLSF